MAGLIARIKDFAPQVTRRNGAQVARRQKIAESMPFDERTFILGQGASMTIILSDDRVAIIRGPVESWTFANLNDPCVRTSGPIKEIYITFERASKGNLLPPNVLFERNVTRIAELEDTLRQQDLNQDSVGAMVTRAQIAELARSMNLDSFADSHLAEVDGLAVQLRGQIGVR